MTDFAKVSHLPFSMRQSYLDALPEPQEWFLEDLVRSGEAWVSKGDAYGVFRGDTLVEFWSTGTNAAHLSGLLHQRPFKKVLCKSFEYALVDAAKDLRWTLVETGYLFRKRNQVDLPGIPGFRVRQARASDVAEAWQMGQDFYDSEEEVQLFLQSGGLWIGTHHGDMVASGTTMPVDGAGRIVDVGMVTRAPHRGKGFGSRMVATLADKLERDGKRPVCGCGPSNIASKTALENAGFVSEHRLVQITVSD